MYNLDKREYMALNGRTAKFFYRENTNDLEIIRDVFVKDKYKICNLDLRKDDIVIDLGAHIGAATLLLATMRPDLKIFAWEAHPANFEILLKNIEENKPKSQINIFREAMWFYDNDEVRMYYGDSSKEGKIQKFIGSLFLIREFYNKRLFKEIPATNLSTAFEENRIFSVRFMKMNIEGSEFGVFKASHKDILNMVDRIHGEYRNIEPGVIKNPRKTLLGLCKGVYNDETPDGLRNATVGPFIFTKK